MTSPFVLSTHFPFFFALFVVHIYMYTAAVVVNMIRNDELDTLKVKVSMKHSWEQQPIGG